jgi:urocanate hydratase
MNKKQRIAAAAGIALVAVATAGGVAVATGDDGDVTVTGSGADKATKAALEATHGGTANSVERDSENGATWEVEVTREDGSTVDVRLDDQYAVVVIEGDHEDAAG